jgi:protein-disulfide isomerase-like protein with CxxC motif
MVKVASIKNIVKGLKPRQKKTMNKHARHHSLKHMRSMARSMKKGATFGQAHSRAMRSVGK